MDELQNNKYVIAIDGVWLCYDLYIKHYNFKNPYFALQKFAHVFHHFLIFQISPISPLLHFYLVTDSSSLSSVALKLTNIC